MAAISKPVRALGSCSWAWPKGETPVAGFSGKLEWKPEGTILSMAGHLTIYQVHRILPDEAETLIEVESGKEGDHNGNN